MEDSLLDLFTPDPVNPDVDDEETSSIFSYYSTPRSAAGKDPTTFITAKKYLAAFLKRVKLAHCPVTLTKLSSAKANQIAHILLPQLASHRTVTF